MKKIVLVLTAVSLATGSFGVLSHEGQQIAVTTECPWLDNKPNLSCVPEGTYELVKHTGTKYKDVLALHNPSLGVTHYAEDKSLRSTCLIHPANFPHELNGCIALGTHYHPDKWGVANSRDALKRLHELIRDSPVELVIRRTILG